MRVMKQVPVACESYVAGSCSRWKLCSRLCSTLFSSRFHFRLPSPQPFAHGFSKPWARWLPMYVLGQRFFFNRKFPLPCFHLFTIYFWLKSSISLHFNCKFPICFEKYFLLNISIYWYCNCIFPLVVHQKYQTKNFAQRLPIHWKHIGKKQKCPKPY